VLVALFVGRRGDLYVLLSRYVTQKATRLPSGDDYLGEHLHYEPMRAILPYRVEKWKKRTGVQKKQR
jgi:hypothetical protein